MRASDIADPEVLAEVARRADYGILLAWVAASLIVTRVDGRRTLKRGRARRRPALLSVVLDVTGRKRVEAELRASERRYRRIVDNASEGIWMYDALGVTTFMNPRMAEMLGVTVEEAVGTSFFAFSHEADIAAGRQRLARRIRGVRESSEIRLRRKDGRDLWVSVESDPLLDDQGRFENALALVTDITDKRTTAAALQRSSDELRQAQKMEAVGLLAGGIAHDFNNLLTVILSSGELLLDELAATDPLRADVEEIRKAGVRASQLTKQLLAFSRKQILTPAVIDLNNVISGIEKMLQTLLGDEIELCVLPAPAKGRVHADAGQLEQVIMNLAVNARDAMPTGGRLTIDTRNVMIDATYASEHAGVVPGPYIMVAVTDTGTGMDRATQERIFEPFFTTKDKSKGTGLGLATVYGIVQQSGGHITVHSELGHGTTFNVYLPRTDRAREIATIPPPFVTSLRGFETILLVEDDAAVRAVIYSILRRNGYAVLEAQNAGEALMMCEQHAGDVHLLLTDVVMPRITGRQLATRIAKLRIGLKVVYMSGYTDDAIVHHGVLEPGIEFLPKPIMPDALLRKLREVLDSPRSD
ncbi:MAG: PAS domain S-box protein [Deltaproteobacteria bacterium]|nr:PAS domain S-box protein [Deltaproteobacteria bacterium]